MPSKLIEIDGSIGEGGGQILRTALTLSMVTGQPCRLTRIRAGRKKPGLLRQHLTALRAAVEVSGATADGAVLGASELCFKPGSVRGGNYRFAVGSAGSATLVAQSVLPALLTASEPSELVIEGGTHNPFAPPFDYLDRVYLPILRRMGAHVTATLERPGFYPAGGGRFRVAVTPGGGKLQPIELLERGAIVGRRAVARVANLPRRIAQRELNKLSKGLQWPDEGLELEEVKDAAGPGNILTAELAHEQVTELFVGFGRVDASAEKVAGGVVQQVRAYLSSGAPVGPYLADQLLVPMALAGGGRYVAQKLTRHTVTNIAVIRHFVDLKIETKEDEHGRWQVTVSGGEA